MKYSEPIYKRCGKSRSKDKNKHPLKKYCSDDALSIKTAILFVLKIHVIYINCEKKISFNSLSSAVIAILNAGQRQSFVIKDYFELNSKFIKEELRQIFNNIYKQSLIAIPDSETKNDEVFQYIVENSSPNNNFSVHNAVYVLMAYYFEYCDIFETPI